MVTIVELLRESNIVTKIFLSFVAISFLGNALCWISKVTLRWAQLVLEWVTVCGQVNCLGK